MSQGYAPSEAELNDEQTLYNAFFDSLAACDFAALSTQFVSPTVIMQGDSEHIFIKPQDTIAWLQSFSQNLSVEPSTRLQFDICNSVSMSERIRFAKLIARGSDSQRPDDVLNVSFTLAVDPVSGLPKIMVLVLDDD